MVRRSIFAVLGGVLVAAGLVALASCSESSVAAKAAPDAATTESGLDSALIGSEPETPPSEDAEPPPGNVCGSTDGLQPSASWPLRGGCPTRAGWSSKTGPTTGQVAWTLAAPVGESSPAVAAGELVWVGTTDGHVYVVSQGAVQYAYRTGGAVKSSPAMDATGHAIVGSADGNLYSLAAEVAPSEQDGGAVDTSDGGPNYTTARRVFALALGPITSSPVIAGDGTIYVGTSDGKLASVKPDGSGTNWIVTTGDTGGSSPAIAQDGTIYVGSSDRKLYAVTKSGSVSWALDLGAPVTGSPAVGGDGAVYVGTEDGKLHAVAPSGTERWAYATGGAIRGTPAVYGGAVYVGSEDKMLHAVSTVSGAERWKYLTLGAVGSPMIDGEGKVYFGAADLRMYVVTSKGNLYYASTLKSATRATPAMGGGTTLYVSTEKALVAVSP